MVVLVVLVVVITEAYHLPRRSFPLTHCGNVWMWRRLQQAQLGNMSVKDRSVCAGVSVFSEEEHEAAPVKNAEVVSQKISRTNCEIYLCFPAESLMRRWVPLCVCANTKLKANRSS